MSKVLTWIFSVIMVLCTVANAGAAGQSAEKLSAKTVAKSAVAMKAKPARTNAPAKKGTRFVPGKVRTPNASSANRLASARKVAKAPVMGAGRVVPAAAGNLPELWGSVTYADGWSEEYAPVGLYAVPTSSNQEFDLLQPGPSANYGGTLSNGVYYWCEVVSFWGMVISLDYKGMDVETGEMVLSEGGSYYTYSMTTDPTTGTIYAVLNVEGVDELVTLSFDNGVEPTEIGVLAPGEGIYGWNSIACGKDGQLYGIYNEYVESGENYEMVSSVLARIDKTTGTVTDIGDTGYISQYMTDSTIDPASGRMFWTVCPADETGFLCEVDLTTGNATKVYDFPNNDEVVGLVVATPAAEAGAPAAVENASAVFQGNSLSGMVNFTAPATLFDGTAATGDLTYTVSAGGVELAKGNTKFGAAVSAEVTLAEAGLYTFEIRVANAVGQSPVVKVKNIYVGNDTPEATKAALVYENGNMNLTWTPVTASINGGYLETEAVRYTVTRYAGGQAQEVAKDIAVTSFSEAVAAPEKLTRYYYEVVATCNGMASAGAQSNTVVLGHIIPPYIADFATDAPDFVTIDANEDGTTWAYEPYTGGMRVSYNTQLDMDDWLISPPVYMEAGKLYDLAASLSGYSARYPERVEIKVGKAATAEAMTTTLLEPTEIANSSSDPMEWSYGFMPEESGEYYIGIHGISDADMYNLTLYGFSVAAGRSSDAPAAGVLTVEPAALGALKSTVRFVAPSKTINDNTLTSMARAELSRDGELIHTWENPAPGAELTFEDTVEESGTYEYSVVCYNEAGNGSIASASAFIGTNLPAAPVNVAWVETANPGEVTISWNPVTVDINGNALDASQVTYQVYAFEGSSRVALTEKISNTSYTYQAVAAGSQEFLQYAVFAYTDAGEGEGEVSNFNPAGTPYKGMLISAEADLEQYILGIDGTGGGQWNVYSDSSLEGIASCDGDDMFIGMQAQYLDQYGELFSGLVSLEGMVNPSVSFYSYNIGLSDDAGDEADDTNEVTVSVLEKGQTEWTDVKTIVVSEASPRDEWGKVTVSLAAYAGKTVQVKFTAVVNAAAYTFIDALRVGSQLEQDLKLQSLAAPAKVKAGENYTVTATVLNDGAKESGAYTVELYADEALVETKECAALAEGATASVEFARTMSVLATEPVDYYAKVVYAADQNMENNQSDNVVVKVVVPAYPVVSDLAGASKGDAVELTWTAPDMNQASGDPVTQDFEDADSFADSYGGWTFADMDGSAVGGFQNMDVPGITPGETKGSFWIWDKDVVGNDSFAAHSGTKYLFSLFRYDDGTVDDWAISPELDGKAQTVSFYAKSYSGTYPEKIEVYYSTGSLTPEDFKLVEGVGGVVPADWTLYEAELPEGAKYFAIRSCATGSFMLMVDDVTFVPGGSASSLKVIGYNVYRDGVKINEATVAETTFTDANVEDGKTYSYVVTVVYDRGESAASNVAEVKFETSGVNGIQGGVNVSVEGRSIVVLGAESRAVEVYTVDGKLVNAVRGEARTVIPASQGVYVVKVGKTVGKVIVK